MDKRLQQDLTRITQQPEKAKPLPSATPLGKIADQQGLAQQQITDDTGVASPLAEADYAEREYYAAQTITSVDGIFTLEIQAIKSVRLVDAKGREIKLEFQDRP